MAKTHGTMDQFEAQVRARISELDPTESVESATNTCGIAAKPDVVKGATYYVDTQGMLGEPGQQYDYDQLWEIWDDNHEDDPVMNEYDSFDYWLRDTVKWFDVIQADTSLDSIPDELTLTIEGSTLEETEDQFNERYVHSMIPEIQRRAAEVADVHDVYIDGTDLVCRFDDMEDSDKEIRVPLDDLTLVWPGMDEDIDYIVDKIFYPDGGSQYDFGEVPMPESDDLAPIDECDSPIMSSSIPYGKYGQMLIDDEKQLRDQYDEGELAPSEIVESLGYVAQDDHVYIKDLGDGCNMVFDFTKYNMSDNDECIQHYFTDETGRVPRGYTVTKMYL